MTRKIYRTAQGKMVDIGALYLKNENVRAVGNMNVNARGDVIDSNNRPIDTRNQQVSRRYKKQTTNVVDNNVDYKTPVPEPKIKKVKGAVAMIEPDPVPPPPEDFEDNFVKSQESQSPAVATGLAGAIAKARTIRQELIKPAATSSRDRSGVNKI